jgi:hypothetical protein
MIAQQELTVLNNKSISVNKPTSVAIAFIAGNFMVILVLLLIYLVL